MVVSAVMYGSHRKPHHELVLSVTSLQTSVNDIDWDDDEWPDVDDWSLPVDRRKEDDPVLMHELFDQDQDQEIDDEVVVEAPKERPVKGPVSIDPLLGF